MKPSPPLVVLVLVWTSKADADTGVDVAADADADSGDFCAENALVAAQTNVSEFGIGHHSKRLHCCSSFSSYKAILWFKGDKLYPWKEDVSGFRLDRKSRNQTLITDSLAAVDGGLYSCLVLLLLNESNANADADSHRRRPIQIHLKVFESGYSGMPVLTYTPPTLVPANLGQSVKVYCEAFVGKIDLPDAQNKITWSKVSGTKITLPNTRNPRTRVKKVLRDNGLTVGLYLHIEKVKTADYGEYACSVSNAADQIKQVQIRLEPEPNTDASATAANTNGRLTLSHLWLIMVYAVGISVLCISFFYILYYKFQFQYRIRLWVREYTAAATSVPTASASASGVEKHASNKKKKNSGSNEYDIFVLYEAEETNFVTGVLLPTLVNEYGYVVNSHVLESDVAVNMECQAQLSASKCVIAVLPSYAAEDTDGKCCKIFSQKLYTASNLHNKVICLLVQNKKMKKTAVAAKYSKTMAISAFIWWPLYKKEWSRQWQSLKLHLPIKRKVYFHFRGRANKNYITVSDRHILCTV